MLQIGLLSCALAVGCSDDGDDNTASSSSSSQTGAGGAVGAGGNASAGGGGSGGMLDCGIPQNGGMQMQAFLDAGDYSSWTAESGPHDSAGPHFGDVRTFVNSVLHDSLEAGNTTHPRCSAAVKELYGSGTTVLGHAVMVKLQDDSAGGQGWHWYEQYQGTNYADAPGDGLCTGCHSSGDDYFRSPFPLQ